MKKMRKSIVLFFVLLVSMIILSGCFWLFPPIGEVTPEYPNGWIETPRAPTNVRFDDSTNTLIWDSCFIATEFEVKVAPNFWELPVVVVTRNRFLTVDCAWFLEENKTYHVFVVAVNRGWGVSSFSDSSNFVSFSFAERQQLNAPENVRIEDGVLRWDSVEGAFEYHIYSSWGSGFNYSMAWWTPFNSLDLTNLSVWAGDGFRIRAIAPRTTSGEILLDSELSESVTYFSFVQIFAPLHVQQNGHVLSWGLVGNADGFVVYRSRLGLTEYSPISTVVSGLSFDLVASLEIRPNDSLRVRAIGRGRVGYTYFIDSELSLSRAVYASVPYSVFPNVTNLRQMQSGQSTELNRISWDYHHGMNATHGHFVNRFLVRVFRLSNGELVSENTVNGLTIQMKYLGMTRPEIYLVSVSTAMEDVVCRFGFPILNSRTMTIEIGYTRRNQVRFPDISRNIYGHQNRPVLIFSPGSTGQHLIEFFDMNDELIHSAVVNQFRYTGERIEELMTKELRVHVTSLRRENWPREFDSLPFVFYFRQGVTIENFEFNALGNRWISWDTVENAFQYHLRILAIQPPSFTVLERFHITPWGDPYLNLAHIGWGGVALEDMFFMFEAVSTLNAIYFGSEVFNYANRNFSLETAPSNFRIEDGYVKWTPIRIEGVYHIQHFNVSVSHPMAGFEVSYTGDSTSVELDGFFDFLYDVLDYDVPITISIVALGFEYDVDETKTFFARSERQYIVFYLKDIQ